MANLDNIPIPSITDMNQDEAIEYLRQLRLSRRTPVAPSASTIKKREAKAASKQPPKLSSDQAADLLRLLEEGI